jgi:fatty-acyl-CoA synthase
MNIAMLLEMAADCMPSRIALGPASGGSTYADLAMGARRVATSLAAQKAATVGYVDVNSPALPLALFGAALAGMSFVPVSYRLSDENLRSLVSSIAPGVVIAGPAQRARIGELAGIGIVSRSEILALAADRSAALIESPRADDDDVAVLIFTSGTTGTPKAAVLRHRNLSSYVMSSVEFMSAAEDECALVSVPPYHIAGVSAMLTSVAAGRRIVQLDSFDASAWVALARGEKVTHAMVVPTMLVRILDVLRDGQGLPHLRLLSYGGGPMPQQVIERAMMQLPDTSFVNAYGLTETSSTVAVLGADDHRQALASSDPEIRARLGSVGRPLPSVEVSIRDPSDLPVIQGDAGEIWVRGDQVAGEYLDGSAQLDGWFRTRDSGHLDPGGYLFVHGRLDDVIVRGGENLPPTQIEAALESHPSVSAAAVVGLPDHEWGEKVVAVVVLCGGLATTEDELRTHVRSRLRSAMTPERIHFRDQLPFNETGKLLRRLVREGLLQQASPAAEATAPVHATEEQRTA